MALVWATPTKRLVIYCPSFARRLLQYNGEGGERMKREAFTCKYPTRIEPSIFGRQKVRKRVLFDRMLQSSLGSLSALL